MLWIDGSLTLSRFGFGIRLQDKRCPTVGWGRVPHPELLIFRGATMRWVPKPKRMGHPSHFAVIARRRIGCK